MNKDLFLRVYRNIVLNRIINNHIRYIHKKLKKTYRYINWNKLTNSHVGISRYGYLDQLKSLPKPIDNETIIRCGMAATKNDHLNILKYVFENSTISWGIDDIFRKALSRGVIDIIEYVNSLEKWSHPEHFFGYAAKSGRIEVCEWYINQFKDMKLLYKPYDFYNQAALSGNIDVLKWGIQFYDGIEVVRSYDTDIALWRCAIKSNNISLLDFMYNNEQFKYSSSVAFSTYLTACLAYAIRLSNLDVIDWFLSKDNGTAFNDKKIYSDFMFRGSVRTIEYCSNKLGYKIENHKNIAEWFFNKCETYGINPIDHAIDQYAHKIIIWMYKHIKLDDTFNPLVHCDIEDISLHLLKWFTENNRPESIPDETLDELYELPTIEYILRNRTEDFPNPQRIMKLLVKYSDSIDLIDKLAKNEEVLITEKLMDKAIAKNRTEVAKWIYHNSENKFSDYFESGSESVRSFIVYNIPELIPANVLQIINQDYKLSKYIIDNYPNQYINENSLHDISRRGKVENVKYLHEYYKKHGINQETNHFDIDAFKQTLLFAIKKRYMDIVKYLCENGPNIIWSNGKILYNQPMFIACKYGGLEICKYLQENTSFKLNTHHMDFVSTRGRLEWVQCITENHGIKCSDDGLESTARKGHYNVVRYLLENKHELTSNMFANAIQRSDLTFVQICLEYQCKYDFNTVDLAAASSCGSLEIVRCLTENGHRGANDAFDIAAQHGNWNIINYLKDNNYVYTNKSIKSAIDNSDIDTIKWLVANIEYDHSSEEIRLQFRRPLMKKIIARGKGEKSTEANNRTRKELLKIKKKLKKIKTNVL